jgi:hypothetical protein
MSDIQTQIARWQRQEISGAQLLRDFVGHEDWLFFVAPGGGERLQRAGGRPDYIIQPNEHGEKRLYIFSDAEMLKTYMQHSGITEWRCEVMASAGMDIFVSLPDDLTGVTINPLTPAAVGYVNEQLKTLRHIADAAFMERELKALSDGSIRDQATLNRVVSDFKRYENFYVVFALRDGDWSFPTYTSNDKLEWAIAFTAKDSAEVFQRQYAAQFQGECGVKQFTGSSLAERVVAANHAGVLFNYLGYVPPLRLNSQFLKIVCNGQ